MPVASTAQRNREYFPRIGTSTVATARSVLLHLPSASTLPMPLTSAQLVLALLTSKPTTIFTTSFVVISVTKERREREERNGEAFTSHTPGVTIDLLVILGAAINLV